MNINENSLLKSWIQNRLREYFVIQEMRLRRSSRSTHDHLENPDYSPILKADNFDVMSHELRILSVETASSANDLEDEWDQFVDMLMGIDPGSRPRRSEHVPYRTAKACLSITYQESINSATKTLSLLAHVGQIDDLSLVEELLPFTYGSEKHTIDIYTKVFPMLEDWANIRGVKIRFAVPKCYFGKYEEGRKASLEQMGLVENDILSKIAAGMEIDNEVPIYESHRLLLLEDVQRSGFEAKNVDNTAFLPLLNVKAALKEIAVIHCTSWAFTKITSKQFTTVWPFIRNQHFLPYLKNRAKLGFPKFIQLVEDHLTTQSIPDRDKLLSRLRSLKSTLFATLATATIPSSGPLCLIHQAFDFSAALFRHSLISQSSSNMNTNSSTDYNGNDYGDYDFKVSRGDQNKGKPHSVTTQNTPMLIKREVCIVDWQSATFGSPMIDVAFMLLTSLPPETRRIETPALLKLYWDEFEEIATRFGLPLPWTADEIFNEFVQGLIYGCFFIAANISPDSKEDEKRADVFVQAIRELIELGAI